MKTFLGIYGFLQLVTLIYWIYTMLFTKPQYNNGSNRFIKNWKEGGKFTLFIFSFLAFILAFVVLVFLAVVEVLGGII